MIKGICFSYDDIFKLKKWPEIFVAVPQKGEVVQAEGGTIAYVNGVTHCVRPLGAHLPGEVEPYIKVELYRKYAP